MNCPSRTDEPFDAGYNQNPPHLSADLTTTADFSGIINIRNLRRMSNELSSEEISSYDALNREPPGVKDSQVSQALGADLNKFETNQHATIGRGVESINSHELTTAKAKCWKSLSASRLQFTNLVNRGDKSKNHVPFVQAKNTTANSFNISPNPAGGCHDTTFIQKVHNIAIKYAKFIGPGFMISVAYIDPGNYSTDIAAGASFRFKLLFVVLMSNMFAVFLQSLCVKLGTVTGLNLAENCRAHCPKWLNISLYILAEVAIIATDIAEVIGTAIALNLLCPKIPLVAGCALSILDVFLILIFYRPNGSVKGLQAFEIFVAVLVLGVVVSFCLELSLINDAPIGDVFRGYIPSSALLKSKGLYQACGILGATVMPHSLYLGSGIVQPRLVAFDIKYGYYTNLQTPTSAQTNISAAPSPDDSEENAATKPPYKPSFAAIKFCLKYSIVEVSISLFTFALFVNSAILIVAGASLSNNPTASDADLFGIHTLLSNTLSPAAGTIFALALLLSGISAGIVCTIAGQMVSEGALNWSLPPWLRRLVTRSISIIPSIIVAGAVGREGLSEALNATQVVLSIVLPFVSAPLIWFTCCGKYMTVESSNDLISDGDCGHHARDEEIGHGQRSPRNIIEAENGIRNAPDAASVESGNLDDNVNTNPLFLSTELESGPGAQNHDNGDWNGDTSKRGNRKTGNDIIRMENHWITTVFAVCIWLIIAIMNVANLVLLKNQ